jgi:hypothetical protein
MPGGTGGGHEEGGGGGGISPDTVELFDLLLTQREAEDSQRR